MENAPMRNNYYYYGQAITRRQFLQNVNEEEFEKWENSGEYRELNDFSDGGYKATAVTDKEGNLI